MHAVGSSPVESVADGVTEAIMSDCQIIVTVVESVADGVTEATMSDCQITVTVVESVADGATEATMSDCQITVTVVVYSKVFNTIMRVLSTIYTL